jgi:hypothetical protein
MSFHFQSSEITEVELSGSVSGSCLKRQKLIYYCLSLSDWIFQERSSDETSTSNLEFDWMVRILLWRKHSSILNWHFMYQLSPTGTYFLLPFTSRLSSIQFSYLCCPKHLFSSKDLRAEQGIWNSNLFEIWTNFLFCNILLLQKLARESRRIGFWWLDTLDETTPRKCNNWSLTLGWLFNFTNRFMVYSHQQYMASYLTKTYWTKLTFAFPFVVWEHSSSIIFYSSLKFSQRLLPLNVSLSRTSLEELLFGLEIISYFAKGCN